MSQRVGLQLLSLVFVLTIVVAAEAQRGGDRGGDRGGWGGGDFRSRILERIDANGNGTIEPEEAQGRAQGWIERMAREAGLEPGRPLPIRQLLGGSGRDNSRDNDRSRDGGRERDSNPGKNDNEVDQYPTIPGFGDESVQSFGLSPLTLAGKIVDLEKKYDRRVMDTVNRTMSQYDKNKNGILDHDEWKGIPWRSDPRESDLDKDGILTKAEYAERIHKRYNSDNDRRSRDRGGDRSDDRGRDRSDDRGRDRSDDRGRDRGDDRGGDRGDEGRDRGRRGGFDPSSFISRLDTNGNGRIDPDEVDERRRKFFADRFQLDFSKPIEISEITARFRQRYEDRSREREGDSGGRRGRENEEKSSSESYRVDGSDRAKGRKSYRSEGRALPNALPSWWEDRDENGDGQITLNEFSSSVDEQVVEDFQDFDINRDGLITAREAEIVEDDE